jgi:hypothetical protein
MDLDVRLYCRGVAEIVKSVSVRTYSSLNIYLGNKILLEYWVIDP